MINSELTTVSPGTQEEAVDGIVQSGARGAILLAGLTTAIVIALWIVFYVVVFAPRGAMP